MDLKTAVQIVGDDARDDINPGLTDAEAVAYHRDPVTGITRDEINGGIDDPEVREAYHAVLDATDAALEQATT
jgi:hypothetical protein